MNFLAEQIGTFQSIDVCPIYPGFHFIEQHHERFSGFAGLSGCVSSENASIGWNGRKQPSSSCFKLK